MKSKEKAFETLKVNTVKPIINKEYEKELIKMKKIKYSLMIGGKNR